MCVCCREGWFPSSFIFKKGQSDSASSASGYCMHPCITDVGVISTTVNMCSHFTGRWSHLPLLPLTIRPSLSLPQTTPWPQHLVARVTFLTYCYTHDILLPHSTRHHVQHPRSCLGCIHATLIVWLIGVALKFARIEISPSKCQ